jgi:type II secretory pathway pseudopilin PulG
MLRRFAHRDTNSEKGSALLETLMAIAILGLVGTAFASGLSTSSNALIVTDKGGTAKNLAETQMEHVKKHEYEPSYSPFPIPPKYDTYAAQIDSAPFEDGNIQKITVTIDQDGKVVKVLEGYKVNR